MSGSSSPETSKVKKLEAEVKALQDMFRQLTEEDRNESYDRRRSKMLKAQLVLLERQCVLLTDALSARASVVAETENELLSLIDDFQKCLAQDKPGPIVHMSRKQLVAHIHALQKLKGSIRKQSVLCSAESLRIPQLSGIRLCKSADVSCLEVCTGKIDHINLQHVAYLESKLVALLKSLTSLQVLLQSTIAPVRPSSARGVKAESKNPPSARSAPERFLFSSGFRKIVADAGECVDQIESCCQDLLALSLLHPSAPWSVTKPSSKFGLFEPSAVVRGLPVPLQRQKDVKSLIAALCKAHSYLMHVNALKLNAVRHQVDSCNQMASTHAHYMNSLLDGVTKAYADCEQRLSDRLRGPLAEILESWFALKSDQTEKNMRQFMSSFKANEEALSQLVESVNASVENTSRAGDSSTESGPKVLETFGVELRDRIDLLKRECAKEASLVEKKTKVYVQTHEEDIITRLRKVVYV